MSSDTGDGRKSSRSASIRDTLARRPGHMVGIAAAFGVVFAAVADLTDGDPFNLWLWGGTVATVWALALAVGIWFLTAADTSKVLEQLDAQSSNLDGARRQLTQLALHGRESVTTPIGPVVTSPSTATDVQMVKIDGSVLEDRLLAALEDKTGVSRDEVRDGQKVYETGRADDPWVLTAQDGRQWLVTVGAAGRRGIVSQLFSTKAT